MEKSQTNLTLGSLFDGSGGFPLAGILTGITPLWASEIEPFPIAVTKYHFPDMQHLGDVSKIHGHEIKPVDVITFGSPCQDMSITGKRAGLKNQSNGDDVTTRSGLFYEAARIIKEMRDATNGLYPTYAVWENVPGAFTSNKGQDFKAVLETLAQIKTGRGFSIPMPHGGGGRKQDVCWETITPSRGERLTLNTSECPNVAVESTLWQILQDNAPQKYYLSAKACQGILNRAQRRGKELPTMLREALLEAVELKGVSA